MWFAWTVGGGSVAVPRKPRAMTPRSSRSPRDTRVHIKKAILRRTIRKCLELGKCLELDRTARPMPILFGPSGYPCRKYECFGKKTCPVPQSIRGRRTTMAQALSQRPTSETHVLKMLSQGAPMMQVLNELCNFIDPKSPGVIPTVLLPDGDGHLRLAAGPKIPQIWNEAFESMRIPSYASFHSMPGHQEKLVPVADMRGDPSFAACWDLALSQSQRQPNVPLLGR